jgi:lipooligosaccharide transport system permease protein
VARPALPAGDRLYPIAVVRVVRRNFLSWRRFYRTSLVSALGEPLLLLVGLGWGLGRLVGTIEGVPYAEYIASGIVASSVMNVATFETTFGAFARMREQHTYDAIRATPVSLTEIIGGDILFGAAKCALNATIIVAVLVVAGLVRSRWALALPPAGFLLGIPFGALGMVVTSRAQSWDSFTYYFTLGISVMFFFSGIFFPLASLPLPARALAWCLPLTHAVAITRALAVGQVGPMLLVHAGILAGIALVAFRSAVRRMHRRLVI